jgi:hypothetical protein
VRRNNLRPIVHAAIPNPTTTTRSKALEFMACPGPNPAARVLRFFYNNSEQIESSAVKMACVLTSF